MKPLEINISDRARLWVVNTDKFKKNILTMTVFLPVGERTTPADMLYPGILLRGSKNYPTNADIKRRLEELYAARINTIGGHYGDSLINGFVAEFLSDGAVNSTTPILESVIELLGEIWERPALERGGLLRSSEVKTAKAALCDSIKAEMNNTAAYAFNRCREMVCPGEPYGYSVTESHVAALGAQEITDRYKYVKDNARITFFYVGSRPASEVAELLEAAFPARIGQICEENRPITRATSPLPPQTAVYAKDDLMPVSQSKLVMGFTTDGVLMADSREYYAMCLMAEVLGGSSSSKLFVNVRERMSLCYYVGAHYENFKGVMYVSCGIESANREAAQSEAARCLDMIRGGVISDAEIDAARLSMISNCRQISDSPVSIMSFCLGRLMRAQSCSTERFIERVNSIEKEEIISAASRVKLKAVYFLGGTLGDEEGTGVMSNEH